MLPFLVHILILKDKKLLSKDRLIKGKALRKIMALREGVRWMDALLVFLCVSSNFFLAITIKNMRLTRYFEEKRKIRDSTYDWI